MLAWILEHAGLDARLPDRRRAAELRRLGAPDRQRVLRRSRPTSTTPRSSTSARSSSTTGRAPRSSTTSSTTTPTSFPTSRRSRRSSTTSCARCRAADAWSSTAATRALARVLARGCWSEVERFGLGRGRRRPGPDWTIARRRHDPARRRAAGHAALAARIAAARRPQPDERARRDRGRAARRRAGRARRSRRSRAFRGVKRGAWKCAARARGVTVYDDFAHHPTAIATTIEGLRRAVGHARILAVLEPRSNTMKLGAMKDRAADEPRGADRTFCYAREPRLGRRRGARAARRARAGVRRPRRAGRRVARDARAGDHVLVMSNGGFGGVHGKLLDALAAAPGALTGRTPRDRAYLQPDSRIVYLHGFRSSPQSRRRRRWSRASPRCRPRSRPTLIVPDLEHAPADGDRARCSRGSTRNVQRARRRSRSSAARSAGTMRRISPSASARAPC